MSKTDSNMHGANRAQFEEIYGLAQGTQLAPDGRVVLWVDNQAWVPRLDVHAARKQAAAKKAAAAKARNKAGEKLGPSCPKCGEATNQTLVCPRCAMGKAGLRYQYACTCGVTFFTKETL